MAREANQFYKDPTAEIGSSLATALFGDPAAALKQRQAQATADAQAAQAEEARAHASVYRGQATGLDTTNAANASLSDVISNLFKTKPAIAARAPAGAESDDAGEIAAVPGVNADQAFKSGLPALFASMVQGGHGSDIDGTVRAAAAFGGGDEMARRGLVAGGATPGADFAITPERADQIRIQDSQSKLAQVMGVATINNRDNIPVANIKAASDAAVAGINNSGRADVANIKVAGASGDRYTGGWTPRARNGGDNSDAAVDGKIAGMVRFLGLPANADISKVDPAKIAKALALSEGGSAMNPANIKTVNGKGFMNFGSPQAAASATAALVSRKLAAGQNTIQSLVEGLPAGGGAASGLSADALDRAAQNYNLTGKIPTNLGRGGAVQQRILSRAAELAGGTSVGDQLAGQAARSADGKSLAQLQKQVDAMSGFERTTLANGKAAIDQAVKNGGPSTVTAWNQWVQGGRRALANPGVRALDIAVQTLASEYGKAIGGGANGNAALTDSARKEAQSHVSSAMTVAELKSAVGQMTIDMGNRRRAYQGQLNDIKGRISGSGAGAAPNSAPARIVNDADYARLAPGTRFTGPDGVVRRKPE